MKSLNYWWKYYIKPILIGLNPNSQDGLKFRIENLEDKRNKK